MNNTVLMLVRNSVTRDARVQKEANSLVANGFDVNLVGVVDAKYTLREEILDSGLLIKRVPFRSLVFKLNFYMMFLLNSALVALCIFFYNPVFSYLEILFSYLEILFYYLTSDFISDAALNYSIVFNYLYQNLFELLYQGFYIGGSFFVIYLLTLKMMKYYKFYKSYKKIEIGDQANIKRSYLNIFSHIYNFFALFMKLLTRKKSLFSSVSQVYKQAVVTFFYGVGVNAIYKNKNCDYVHCHDISTLLVGVYLKKKYGIKLIYDAHEIYEEAVGVGKGVSIFYKLTHWFSQRYIDGFITINKSFCDVYKSKYPMLPKATLVMNATVVFENIVYDGRLHEASKLPIDNKIILFQGGFSRRRGIERLLEASKYIEDGWSLVFMGWGPLEPMISKFQTSYPGKVCMIGPAPQAELPLWTSGAYIGVIPYEDYGMNHLYCTPNKLWEYPNAGVPIVASPRIELERIITENNTGWIYDEGLNAAEFAKFLTSLDSERGEKVEGCSRFIKNNNWSIYEKNIIEMYAALE